MCVIRQFSKTNQKIFLIFQEKCKNQGWIVESHYDGYHISCNVDSNKIFEPNSLFDIPPSRKLSNGNDIPNKLHEIVGYEFDPKFSEQIITIYYHLIENMNLDLKIENFDDLQCQFDENNTNQIIDYINKKYINCCYQ